MHVVNIKGVNVKFPFEPYDLQKHYMEKVIECLQTESNAVLESPTGTGKTLSLLCSSLAWLELKKAHLQTQNLAANKDEDNFLNSLNTMLQNQTGKTGRSFLGLPTIIYASRTHSQLTQAMQELKRTAYSYMKAYVLGSRDQMCIHPELASETNSNIVRQMCQLKVKTRSCSYYNLVEKRRDIVSNINVIDIEDIVKLGKNHKFCPYFMAKELQKEADIIFLPYNYLLDPFVRKALGVNLANNVVILDEAHNIERMCEESASLQLKTSDIALAIEEVTAVMKMSQEPTGFNDSPKDFSPDDLCNLKQMLLDFEKAFDTVELSNSTEGTSFDGNYIFELLSKANINTSNCNFIIGLLSNISQFLNVVGDGPFARRGMALGLFGDFLSIVFMCKSNDFKEVVKKCYKVHIIEEKPAKKKPDNWLSKATAKSNGRILNYWCFSPGFGMNMLMETGVKCVILTSGTLAPLKPLVSELRINIPVRLENPHIVTSDQVCVKIVPMGPDQEVLNCNYQNRDNIKYISSVGRSILNITRVIPDGLLVFFPSYPIMDRFQQHWQETGLWSSINEQKAIYVEPKDRNAFAATMETYYAKIKDVNTKGAIFMGVCRGKVSEGLDFADANGRAVVVIGLPYPPLKDPKIMLKKQYLDRCHANDKEFLKGDDWYSLEASRAVNQAIGRVIRHSKDYGAIILLDTRFNNFRIKNQMSMWLRNHIKVVKHFGEVMRDLKCFFNNIEVKSPPIKMEVYSSETKEDVVTHGISSDNGSFDGCSTSKNSPTFGEVTLHKRNEKEELFNPTKRKKINLIPNTSNICDDPAKDSKEYILMVKKSLDPISVTKFISALKTYNDSSDFDEFIGLIDKIFETKGHLRYLVLGLDPYIKNRHKSLYKRYCEDIRKSY